MSDTDKQGAPSGRAALQLLERYGGRLGKRAVAIAAAWQLASPALAWLQRRRRQRDYTITVGGTDEIYPDLHEWVLAQIPAQERRAMLLDTSSRGDYDHDAKVGPPATMSAPRVRLRYDGSRVQEVDLDGHRIEVSVARDDLPGGRENLSENWRRYLERITFTCSSLAGRDAVVAMIERLVEAKRSRDVLAPLLIPSRWSGDWQRRSDLKPRALESVVLKAGQLERLVSDLQRFIDREEEYARLCQPWHRGYLFHGTPGTGKTSAARALAHHFRMPVHYLPLADLERDTDLMHLIQAVRPRSMLLLEDVDVYRAVTERDDGPARVSLAAMLNALDGVWTPHGLVTVLTTNRREDIDEALMRAGRVDVQEEFSPLDADQATRLGELLGPHAGSAEDWIGRSPAEMMDALWAQRDAVSVAA